jgi:hypothetical protein
MASANNYGGVAPLPFLSVYHTHDLGGNNKKCAWSGASQDAKSHHLITTHNPSFTMSLPEYTPQEITLEQFHEMLSDSYAVSVNDTLYFVGYDTDGSPYVADNDNQDRIDLDTVDGSIEAHPNYVFFYVQGKPIQVVFLQIKKPDSF